MDLSKMPAITLEWEDQAQSSALYVKYRGRVIGIRATVARLMDHQQTSASMLLGCWEARDCWMGNDVQPKYSGRRVGFRIGHSFMDRNIAKAEVDRLIANGQLTMNHLMEE